MKIIILLIFPIVIFDKLNKELKYSPNAKNNKPSFNNPEDQIIIDGVKNIMTK